MLTTGKIIFHYRSRWSLRAHPQNAAYLVKFFDLKVFDTDFIRDSGLAKGGNMRNIGQTSQTMPHTIKINHL
jgi:hypothetical protein